MTTLFAGLAFQARQRFGIKGQHLHIDTTSFSVSGEYTTKEEDDPVPIAITYGYSRDHREDLKQWMLALVTTHDADVPLFLRPLDGNSSDKVSLSATVKEVMKQLREQLPETAKCGFKDLHLANLFRMFLGGPIKGCGSLEDDDSHQNPG